VTTLTLFAKVHKERHLKQIETILDELFEGLDAKYEIINTSEMRWVQIEVTGKDEVVASNYIAKNIGLVPVNIGKARKFADHMGLIESHQSNENEILVDIGVFQPKIFYGKISLGSLQKQLVGGVEVGMPKIVELFALGKNMPVGFKVNIINDQDDEIDGELSAAQVRKFRVWRDSLLDRLIIVGASLTEVRRALEQAIAYKDVIDIETLGILEHALICKLGTDAVGLIPRIGKILRSANLDVFSPRKIASFLGTETIIHK
jgi:hypothetical protein